MPAPDGAIRAKRKLTHRLIAAPGAARLRPHMTDDMLVIAGDEDRIRGADDGARPAEAGRWVGSCKGGVEISAAYMAARPESRGRWPLERELYDARALGRERWRLVRGW